MRFALNMMMLSFVTWIEHRMELLGIRDQQALSAISGISLRTVSAIMNGGMGKAERSTRVWLARTLKVPLRMLEDFDDGRIGEIPDTVMLEWEHCGRGRTDRALDRTEFMPVAGGVGVPVLGRVAAGGLVESFTDWDEETGLRLPFELPGAEGAYALEIAGDSMVPLYQPGEYIILRNVPVTELKDGEDAMIQLDGDGDGVAAFKRVYIVGDRLKLVSLNPKYEPSDVLVSQVARVGRFIGKFTPPRLLK